MGPANSKAEPRGGLEAGREGAEQGSAERRRTACRCWPLLGRAGPSAVLEGRTGSCQRPRVADVRGTLSEESHPIWQVQTPLVAGDRLPLAPWPVWSPESARSSPDTVLARRMHSPGLSNRSSWFDGRLLSSASPSYLYRRPRLRPARPSPRSPPFSLHSASPTPPSSYSLSPNLAPSPNLSIIGPFARQASAQNKLSFQLHLFSASYFLVHRFRFLISRLSCTPLPTPTLNNVGLSFSPADFSRSLSVALFRSLSLSTMRHAHNASFCLFSFSTRSAYSARLLLSSHTQRAVVTARRSKFQHVLCLQYLLRPFSPCSILFRCPPISISPSRYTH